MSGAWGFLFARIPAWWAFTGMIALAVSRDLAEIAGRMVGRWLGDREARRRASLS